jgi:hypothetical protein
MADTYTQVKDITVNITTESVAGSVGLGTPLVIAGMSEAEVAYTECSSMAEVTAAGFAAETEVYKACAKIFAQKNKPKTVAVCATTGKVAAWLAANGTKDFRHIIPVLGASDSTVAELVTAVSALNHKMLFVHVNTVDELPKTQSENVVGVVYNGETEYPNAAVVGASAGLAAGSLTYKNLVLTDVEPEALTTEQVNAIHNANGMCIIKKAGDVVTSEGKTTDGEYIDVVDCKDFVIQNIEYRAQKLLNDNPKLSFDNVGITMLENAVTSVLAEAYNNGVIATKEDGTPDYSTDFASRAETSASDRASRTYNGGKFTFGLAGAIHNATIKGTLVV